MHADQVPVAGQPHVALEPVGAELDRPLVGGQGVFGQLGRGAAMGDDERPPGGLVEPLTIGSIGAA